MNRRLKFVPGLQLDPLEIVPLTRTTLALFCGASGDHHPLHVDTDWVRENTPLPDVIGHGMLTMAYLGRLVTDNFEPSEIRSLSTRFVAPTHIGDRIVCRGFVDNVTENGRETRLELELTAETSEDRTLARGRAIMVICNATGDNEQA